MYYIFIAINNFILYFILFQNAIYLRHIITVITLNQKQCRNETGKHAIISVVQYIATQRVPANQGKINRAMRNNKSHFLQLATRNYPYSKASVPYNQSDRRQGNHAKPIRQEGINHGKEARRNICIERGKIHLHRG